LIVPIGFAEIEARFMGGVMVAIEPHLKGEQVDVGLRITRKFMRAIAQREHELIEKFGEEELMRFAARIAAGPDVGAVVLGAGDELLEQAVERVVEAARVHGVGDEVGAAIAHAAIVAKRAR